MLASYAVHSTRKTLMSEVERTPKVSHQMTVEKTGDELILNEQQDLKAEICVIKQQMDRPASLSCNE